MAVSARGTSSRPARHEVPRGRGHYDTRMADPQTVAPRRAAMPASFSRYSAALRLLEQQKQRHGLRTTAAPLACSPPPRRLRRRSPAAPGLISPPQLTGGSTRLHGRGVAPTCKPRRVVQREYDAGRHGVLVQRRPVALRTRPLDYRGRPKGRTARASLCARPRTPRRFPRQRSSRLVG